MVVGIGREIEGMAAGLVVRARRVRITVGEEAGLIVGQVPVGGGLGAGRAELVRGERRVEGAQVVGRVGDHPGDRAGMGGRNLVRLRMRRQHLRLRRRIVVRRRTMTLALAFSAA